MRDTIARLRAMAPAALAQMYVPEERLFAFRVMRQAGGGLARQGISRRYTAIALIGLSSDGLDPSSVLGGDTADGVCERLLAELPWVSDLGEAALIAWAASAMGHPKAARALQLLRDLRPTDDGQPTVEASWALAALTLADNPGDEALRRRLAERLMGVFGSRSQLFAHSLGAKAAGLRGHVCCFADLVYPILSLSLWATHAGNRDALAIARACAARTCALQGGAGQWWWHYDHRTGAVIEEYPVYAIHQNAMGPMALLALEDAGGGSWSTHVARGLAWLQSAPELSGGSLIDAQAGMLWRKVARREPRKAARYLQATAARVHPRLRAPGIDVVFRPGAVDYEDRPYQWGWFLFAWSATRGARRMLREDA